MNKNTLKIAVVEGLFLLFSLSASAIPPDSLLAIYGGGGSSIKPDATNAVLEASMAYTDLAISKAYLLTEAHIATSPTNTFYPSLDVVVLDRNSVDFYLDNDFTLEGEAIFECYSPSDTPVYIASKSEQVANKVWSVLFTSSTIGSPIDFDLVITVQPTNVDDKSAKQVIFKLRRTF